MMMVESPFKGAPGQLILQGALAGSQQDDPLLHAGQSYLAPKDRKK